jgi:6-phosphofructokinase 1
VQHIHKEGGSILGYSAETLSDEGKVSKVVDVIEERGINQLFVLGNVETCKAASAIQMEAVRRKIKLSVIMIPKSIENNFPYIDKCIGFDTVVQGAVDAIHRTLLAASSVQGGIGIIKLGSGFMCLTAVMASGDADVCLLKHINFSPQCVFQYVEKVIAVKGYAVIVVEDGAAEELVRKWQQQLAKNPAARQPVGGSMDECMGKLPTLIPRAQSERVSGTSGESVPSGQVDTRGLAVFRISCLCVCVPCAPVSL